MTTAHNRAGTLRPILVDIGPTGVIVRGPARILVPALNEAEARWSWDNNQHAITFRCEHLDSVVAALKSAGRPIELRSST